MFDIKAIAASVKSDVSITTDQDEINGSLIAGAAISAAVTILAVGGVKAGASVVRSVKALRARRATEKEMVAALEEWYALLESEPVDSPVSVMFAEWLASDGTDEEAAKASE